MYADGVRDRFPMLPPAGPDGKVGEIKFVDDRGRMSGGAEGIGRREHLSLGRAIRTRLPLGREVGSGHLLSQAGRISVTYAAPSA